MKNTVLVIAGLLVPTVATAQAVPTLAAAQPAPGSPTPSTSLVMPPALVAPPSLEVPGEEPQGRIGVELALLPVGSLKASAGDTTLATETAVALGIGGVLQHPIDHTFTVELAPRMVFHVKGSKDDASATELDVRGRVTAGGYVSPDIRLYAAFEPGYSVLFMPDRMTDVTSPNGFTVGFAVGAAFKAAPKAMVTTELGYQFGYQSTRILGTDVELKSDFLHFAVGVLFDL
jgi:hypothetical protein